MRMMKLVLATAIALASMQPVAEGKATRYGPGVMDIAVANRVKWGQIDLSVPHKGYVALAEREHLGRRVVIRDASGRLWGPYLVADCGARHHQGRLDEIGFAVDLSYEVAMEMLPDMDAPLHGVQVYLLDDG